jgi:anti-sigma-K factor RskA
MRMRISRHQPHTLAGAYALDALAGPDRARFERHLTRCEHCAAEISEFGEVTARLAAAAAAEPPPGLTRRALAAAARTRQFPPATPEDAWSWPTRPAAINRPAGSGYRPASARRRGWPPRLALAAAAAVIAAALLLGVAARTAAHRPGQQQLPAHAIAAILTAPDATMLDAHVTTGGTATIVMSRRQRALVFAAAGLRPLPPSECYELWLMGPGGDRAAGMLPGPRHGMTGPVIASGLTAGDRLGLAVEPAGGAPRPGTTVILVIPL